MADTKITHLRNLMTPMVNYFSMLKAFKTEKSEKKREELYHILNKELDQVQINLPEILTIINEIPNDAI